MELTFEFGPVGVGDLDFLGGNGAHDFDLGSEREEFLGEGGFGVFVVLLEVGDLFLDLLVVVGKEAFAFQEEFLLFFKDGSLASLLFFELSS